MTAIRLASHDSRNAMPWRTPFRAESSRMKALLCRGPAVMAAPITRRSRTIGSVAPGRSGRPGPWRTGRPAARAARNAGTRVRARTVPVFRSAGSSQRRRGPGSAESRFVRPVQAQEDVETSLGRGEPVAGAERLEEAEDREQTEPGRQRQPQDRLGGGTGRRDALKDDEGPAGAAAVRDRHQGQGAE